MDYYYVTRCGITVRSGDDKEVLVEFVDGTRRFVPRHHAQLAWGECGRLLGTIDEASGERHEF